jgi:hypothetical protein
MPLFMSRHLINNVPRYLSHHINKSTFNFYEKQSSFCFLLNIKVQENIFQQQILNYQTSQKWKMLKYPGKKIMGISHVSSMASEFSFARFYSLLGSKFTSKIVERWFCVLLCLQIFLQMQHMDTFAICFNNKGRVFSLVRYFLKKISLPPIYIILYNCHYWFVYFSKINSWTEWPGVLRRNWLRRFTTSRGPAWAAEHWAYAGLGCCVKGCTNYRI